MILNVIILIMLVTVTVKVIVGNVTNFVSLLIIGYMATPKVPRWRACFKILWEAYKAVVYKIYKRSPIGSGLIWSAYHKVSQEE